MGYSSGRIICSKVGDGGNGEEERGGEREVGGGSSSSPSFPSSLLPPLLCPSLLTKQSAVKRIMLTDSMR